MTQGYRAVIFDCDGTLVYSADAHFKAFQTATMAQGRHMDSAFYDARTGLDRVSILTEFAAEVGEAFDIDLACQQSIEAFLPSTAAVSAIPETADLVHRLGSDFPMAVGTNSETELARASLKSTDLLRYFKHISSISDGLSPKPAPDIFANAAARLDVSASKVVVLEDSDEGVQAALGAGMDVVKLV